MWSRGPLLLLILLAVTVAAEACPPPDPARPPVVRLGRGELSMLARVAWAENRSGGYCGMLSIANVIVNRMTLNPKTFGATVTQVVNKPYQFSVFGKTDANNLKMARVDESDDDYVKAVLAAVTAVSGADITMGSTYFHSGKTPSWAASMLVTSRQYGHTFLKPKP